MREARAAAALRHENIATVHQFGMRLETGQYFYAMELIEGETLDERIRRAGPLDARTTIQIAQQVTSALAAAEKQGLVHRDLKPANLMLISPDGETSNNKKMLVKIIDFGLAKAIHTATDPKSLTHDRFVGTPAFASPEQFEHSALDVRSDIYSLGETLWFALTGKTPFAGRTMEEIRRAQKSNVLPFEQLKSAHVPHRLKSLLGSMLAFDPTSRPGTQELAARLQRCSPEARSVRRTRFTLAAAALLVLGMSVLFIFRPSRIQNAPLTPAAEKSIAVLPFENLSEDKTNAYFADGVQDEILTDLARIADLKVISRTSVMHYKSGVARNLRDIGQQLGVANVVEGTVQRSGNRVRVNAQLINARTDKQLWGQVYDRDLADVFAIQSEIAKTIADQLQAKLSPHEEKAIGRRPTSDVAAFDLYTRAKNILLLEGDRTKAELLQAVDLLNRAVARDPSFFDAYCQLAYANDWLYFIGHDHTPARLASAEAAIQAAARLRPDAGETHLARAQNLYWGYRDYDGALAEVEVARQTLPNDPRIFRLTALLQKRQGDWEESTRNIERAVELDPRNVSRLLDTAKYYGLHLRRYAEAKALLDRALVLAPDNLDAKLIQGNIDADWKADLRPAIQIIDSIRTTNPAALSSIADYWLWVALAQRDAAAAENALTAAGSNPIGLIGEVFFNRAFIEGVIARMTKDDAKARSAFAAARAEQEKIVQAQPDDSRALCALGLIDAGLGRKEDALREGRRAIELLPVEKDAVTGVYMIQYLGLIAAWVGDKDLAFEQLDSVVRLPGNGLSYGDLKLDPLWDSLRGDPRFEKLVEEAKLPVALSESKPGSHSDRNFAPVPKKSIAVLPFENRSRDPDNAYFAEGVQDEILTRLSKVADLKVISRTSTQNYKSAPQNLPEIAKQLGVAHILEGSVQKSGDGVRVNVQLIKAPNDAHLWAETYDRKLTDIFAIESEIAKTVADALRAKLTGSEERAISSRPTNNPAAYQLYLRGRYFWNKRTGNSLEKAIDYFNQAIVADPKYALAYAGLADTYILKPQYGGSSPQECYPKAREAVKTALELDDTIAEAHTALGGVLGSDGDFAGAWRELQYAIQLNPNYATAHHWLAEAVLIPLGRFDEAIAELRRAIELDPLSLMINAALGALFTSAHHYDEAIVQLRRTYEMDPNFYPAVLFLGQALELKGDHEAAIAEYHKAWSLSSNDRSILSYLAYSFARAGKRDEALKLLAEVNQFSADSSNSAYIPAFNVAIVYLGLGDKEEALGWLQKSYENSGREDLTQIRVNPFLDSLRGDPRFEALADKVVPADLK
jgi:TolB-like protein/Flp pilus assembly protein TadD